MAPKKRSTQKAEGHTKRPGNGFILSRAAFCRMVSKSPLPLYEENGQIFGYGHLMEASPHTITRLGELVMSAQTVHGSELKITAKWFNDNIYKGAFTEEDREDWSDHAAWVDGEFKRRNPGYKYQPQPKKQKVVKKPKVHAPPDEHYSVPDYRHEVPQAPVASGSCVAEPRNPTPERVPTLKRRRGDDDDKIAPTRQPAAKRARGPVMQFYAFRHLQQPVAPLLPRAWSPSPSSLSHPPLTPARGSMPVDGLPAFWQQATTVSTPSTSAYLPGSSTQQCSNPDGADEYPTPHAQGTPHLQGSVDNLLPYSPYTKAVAYPSTDQSILLPGSFDPLNDYVSQSTGDICAQRASLLNHWASSSAFIPPRVPDSNVLAFGRNDENGATGAFNAGADNFHAQNSEVVDALPTSVPSPIGNVFDQEDMRVACNSWNGFDDASSFPASPIGPSHFYADCLPYSGQASSGYLGHVHENSHTDETSAIGAPRPFPSPTSPNLSPTGVSHHSTTPAAALASTVPNAIDSAITSTFNTFELCGVP